MNLDHLVSQLPTNPVGVAVPDEVGPEIFDQLKDSQGRFRTQSLFWEHRHESYPAHFTTKRHAIERDGKKYISLYEKYMEIADPTEYQVAIRLLGSWDHWQALLGSKWFQELVTEWRNELRVKMESQRYFEMIEVIDNASTPGQEAKKVQATKWLAERYTPQEQKIRGRPSKAEKKAHLNHLQRDAEDLAADAARIGIKVA
jgi:hypothetical protein